MPVIVIVASVPPMEVNATHGAQLTPPFTEISSCADKDAVGSVHCDRSIVRLHTVTLSGTAIGPKLRVPSARLTLLSMVTAIGAAQLDEEAQSRANTRLINRISNPS